ncbi:MAG TPA: type I-E CRISPR-associated protein Cas5/CasD [Acidobacteriota bacterium]|nr:type I-E CRISPR-associated protein Cas5/CasD [Acidobacteriota bacterium]
MSVRFLILRLDAPLMSFGGVAVDEVGDTLAFPTLSMLAGLIGNALGYRHQDFAQLQRLQERMLYAARRDRPGRELEDFQTVLLGQDFMRQAWTTYGKAVSRGGGSATGTHIRRRRYWADAAYTVALTLRPGEEEPTLEACAEALQSPERPLFIGRKPCLPAQPIFAGMLQAEDFRAALCQAPLARDPSPDDEPLAVWWPREGPQAESGQGRLLAVYDIRDWANQIHSGRRFVWETHIPRQEVARESP